MSKELIERAQNIARQLTYNDDTLQAQAKHTLLECAVRIEELERELECERIRLVACGVVALANTPDSAARAREMSPEYRSASLDDVIRAVDSEMALRQERDALLADNERLRKAIGTWERAESPELQEAEAGLITAMNTTPAQSLARIRNQMREECIAVLEAGRFLHDDAPAARLTREAAKAIRATKEPE